MRPGCVGCVGWVRRTEDPGVRGRARRGGDLHLAGLTGLLAVVTGVSAGFLWAQLRAARHDAQAVERRERWQATMQFFATPSTSGRTMPLELPEDRDRVRVARLIERVQGDSDQAKRDRSLLNEYLAWWELTASSVNDEVQVFDPRLLQLFASGRLIAVWTNYRPFIDAERKRNQDQGLYERLEILARQWTIGDGSVSNVDATARGSRPG